METMRELVQERATRSHFLECMRARLSQLWNEGRTGTDLYKRLELRYQQWDAKLAELDDKIWDATDQQLEKSVSRQTSLF